MPRPDWRWFEEELSYDNAKLAHALIVSGRGTGQTEVFDRGIEALRWLVEMQISENGHFRPIGSNGFLPPWRPARRLRPAARGSSRHGLGLPGGVSRHQDVWWYEQAQRAFDWFLGWNDLGPGTSIRRNGGCRDGSARRSRQRKPGSRIHAGLPALVAEMQVMQNAVTVFSEPAA